MRSNALLAVLILGSLVAGCGPDDNNAAAPMCTDVAAADFDDDSGWGSADYCASPSELGCFPFHESTAETCGPFTTMRTSATTASGADACQALLTAINCGTFTDDADTTLSFHVVDADRFTAAVRGTWKGTDVDTTFYFNPCDDGCLSAVTLETVEPAQQKICEIPRQGKPVCLFPDAAHSVSIVRYDAESIELRMAGQAVGLSRVGDE